MPYLHYTHTHSRERTPEYDAHNSRHLVRRNASTPARSITLSDLDDDGHDDYPYPANHRLSRGPTALTIRDQPSQLERYNIWSNDTRNTEDEERRHSYDARHTYNYSAHHHHSDDEDRTGRGIRLRFNSALERPRTSHHHSHGTHLRPSDSLHRSDRWVAEHWESRERSQSRERSRVRHDSVFGDFEERERETSAERWSRYQRVSGANTEELRPLSGWRRRRLINGD